MPDDHTPWERIDGEEPSEFPDIVAEFGGSGATVEYHCTEEELAEAGFADGFTVRDLDDMPEHESEFVAPPAVGDPMDYLEAPYGCPPRALFELIERWDWTEMPGLARLADILTTEWMAPPCSSLRATQ